MSFRHGIYFSCNSLFIIFTCFHLEAGQMSYQKICDYLEPEVSMTAEDIIRHRGFNVTPYTVQTQDGYLLEMLRMSTGDAKNVSKQPVYLQHGLGGSAFDFIANFGNQSLGYLLTDDGYDVWLGNFRGNAYSMRHTSFNPNYDKAFWDFSWDELAAYDLPAMVDFVLNETGYNQLIYIGHSMGSTTMFALLSSNPQYNIKIKMFIAIAPVATIGHLRTPYALLLPFLDPFQEVMNMAGIYYIKPMNGSEFSQTIMCTVPMTILYQTLLFIYGGFDSMQFNTTRLPVFAANFPKGFSMNTLYHYAQMIRTKKFQYYDHGLVINLEKYGQADPPEYNLNEVSTPVALIWGENDFLADPDDVRILSQSLPNLIAFYRIAEDLWNHFDFIYGVDTYSLQNYYIHTLLKSV